MAKTALTDLTRDRVSAVYKLTQSGERPVMKFSVPSKESLPGRPTLLRRVEADVSKPLGLLAQLDEPIPSGYARPESVSPVAESSPLDAAGARLGLSPRTSELVEELREKRHQLITEARQESSESSTEQKGS